MNQKNEFNPGSKYSQKIEEIIRLTILELEFVDARTLQEKYRLFMQNHLVKPYEKPLSCYICLHPITEIGLLITQSFEDNSIFYFYFHENCLGNLLKKSYRKI